MSCPNPIHYIEIGVCGPHGDFEGRYVVFSVISAKSSKLYWVHSSPRKPGGCIRYWRGVKMLLALTRRLFPEYFRKVVSCVPNK